MRAAQLELTISQYLAALVIEDTQHLGSIESENDAAPSTDNSTEDL
jgi:hypothetical protein